MNWLARILIPLAVAMLAGCAAAPPAPEPPRNDGLLLRVDPAAQPPDPGMVALLAPYRAEVLKLRNPIGESDGGMPHAGRTGTELGAWIADIMRERATQVAGRPVDFAFTNTGGVRAALPSGPVSYETISQILPFDNTLVILDLDGESFHRLLERICSMRAGQSISGGTIEGDAEARLVRATIGGAPLDTTRRYLVVTNNYLSSGGGGMEMLKAFPQQDTGVFQRDAAADHVRALTAAGRRIQAPADYPRHHYPE